MNESQRLTLQRNCRRLAEDIILTDDFLAQLFEERIFEWSMINIIKAEKTESEQAYKMLELLPKRGPQAFQRFVAVLERDYPWLATLLVSTHHREIHHPDSTRHDAPNNDNFKGSTHRGTSESCDTDIKTIVASFVHRQFGQSRRVSERDKKALEKFVSGQLQQERLKYQAMIPQAGRPGSSTSTAMSQDEELEDEVFHKMEVQDHLFRIHVRMEPHLRDQDRIRVKTDSQDQGREEADNGCGGNSREENNSSNNGESGNQNGAKLKLLPDELSFNIIQQEVEELSKKLYRMESLLNQSLDNFEPEHRTIPLPNLISRTNGILRKQEREISQKEERIKQLLHEVNNYSEHIAALEKERRQLREETQALKQNLSASRQEKAALLRKCEAMETERLDKQNTLANLNLLVKDIKASTGQGIQETGRGGQARRGGEEARAGQIRKLEEGARGGQVKRSVRGPGVKQGSTSMFPRRNLPFSRTSVKKKYSTFTGSYK